MTGRRVSFVQPCVNSTWRECMYAAQFVLMCACVRVCAWACGWGGVGGGTPYRLSLLTYGGGDERGVDASSEKRERDGLGRTRNGMKWKWRWRETEGGKGTERENVQLVPVAIVFTHRPCSLVSVTLVFPEAAG